MGEDGGIDPDTKRRKRAESDGEHLKRVAEIVMVLSAMGEMRAGGDPTAAEKSLVAEARERLTATCDAVKPKDLFTREAVRVLVEDLGLNRSRDPLLGFRPPKMSIAEKVTLTKRKMEESKEFAAHSSIYSSQLSTAGFGANPESHSSLFHGAHRFLQDKQSPMSLSAGGFHTASPLVHVPSLASATSSLKQPQVNEMQPAVTAVKSSASPLERDPSVLSLPHTEAGHFRLDAPPNGPAYVTQFREKASTSSSVQSPSACITNLGQANKLLDNTSVKSDSTHELNAVQTSSQVMRVNDLKTSIFQAAPGNLHVGHQPSHALTFVHAPPFLTNHNDIAKNVQRILQQKVSDHPNWTPPSVDYMNKPLNCQVCKITISDVESLLVCDVCEKGTHLKCLQSYGNKTVPKLEWHCPKCLILCSGKPLPPKYGKVTRNIGTSRASPNSGGTQASLEKRSENPDSKGNHQKLIANGNSSLPYLARPSSTGSQHSGPAADSSTIAREMQGMSFPVAEMKTEDGANAGTSTDNFKESSGMPCVFAPMNENFNKHIQSSGLSPCEMQRPTAESRLQPNIESDHLHSEQPSGTAVEIVKECQSPIDSKVGDKTEVPISVEVSANHLHDISTHSTGVLTKPSKVRETAEEVCDVWRDDQDDTHATPNEALNGGDGDSDCGRPSSSEIRSIEWLGDILQVVEEKTYYRSCRINGAMHALQDHVLSHNSQNLYPSKLQALWEDNKTGSKWAIVNRCYFPADLPEAISRPSIPENNEVYASDIESTVLVGSIHGPCEVLHVDKFKEESQRRTHLGGTNGGLRPIFVCKWVYDELKGTFQPIVN